LYVFLFVILVEILIPACQPNHFLRVFAPRNVCVVDGGK
jgi:hypothetical protein